MEKIIITGASGFVGQALQPYLKANSIRYSAMSRTELVNVDPQMLNNSIVIHLAGKAHDLKKTVDPTEYYRINFELTKRIYDAFLASNATKFIFISSVKAAADVVVDALTEDVIPKPVTPYGKSKLMAEEYIQSCPLPNGKFYYILRPCMIHGVGNKGNLNLLYKFVDLGMPYPLAAFDNKRSFLSVENLCFVIKHLIQEPDISSGIFNVADDGVLSTNEVVKILAESLQKSPKLWRISKIIIKYIASFGSKFGLPLTTERLNKLTENYIVSNCKINTALGITFPVSAAEGLRITALSFKKI